MPATRLPSHADVVRVFDEHNFGKVLKLREQVLNFARRQCHLGISRVAIVADPEPLTEASPRLARH